MFEKFQPSSKPESDEPENQSRREFLKQSGALAMVSLNSCALSDPEAEPDPESKEVTESYETQLKNWESMKQIFSNPELEETAKFLDATFKSADAISFKYYFDKRDYETLCMVETEMSAKGKSITDSQLGREILGAISESYMQFWNEDALLERLKADETELGLTATFKGFERLQFTNGETLSNEEVRTLIEQKFPNKQWLYENIGTFRYSDVPQHAETFRVAGTAEERRLENTMTPGKEQEVVIHQHATPIEKHEFLQLVAHEIAHHHDWIGTVRLPLHERMRFLRDVTAQFQAPDRLHDSYVDRTILADSAEIKGADKPEAILYRQVVEYWATINEQYDTYANFAEVYPGEAKLIADWRARLSDEL